jgi:hypothetical protein
MNLSCEGLELDTICPIGNRLCEVSAHKLLNCSLNMHSLELLGKYCRDSGTRCEGDVIKST